MSLSCRKVVFSLAVLFSLGVTKATFAAGSGSVTISDASLTFDQIIRNANYDITTSGYTDYTVNFNLGTVGGTIGISNALAIGAYPNVGAPFTVKSLGIGKVTIDGSGGSKYALIATGTGVNRSLTVDNIAMENSSSSHGGAIQGGGSITVNNSSFSTNISDYQGGAIQGSTADINVTDSYFSGNTTSVMDGGAVYGGGNVTVTGTQPITTTTVPTSGAVFTGNSATGTGRSEGGAIYAGGAVTATNYYFSENSTSGNNPSGGAIASGGQVTVSGSVFQGNSVTDTATGTAGMGGAIYAGNGLNVSNSSFTGNAARTAITGGGTANSYGGGIYVAAGDAQVTDTSFSGNIAVNAGGAIYIGGNTGQTLTFTTNTPITLNALSSSPTTGDNDIASRDTKSTFVKVGTGTLTLNTNNSQWLGYTTVNAGSMIVGATGDNSSAVWGNSSQPTPLVVEQGVTMGGFGTIYTNPASFILGSTFLAGLTTFDAPTLISNDRIVVEGSNLLVQPASSFLPEGTYTIASTTYDGALPIRGTFANASVSTMNNLNLQYEIDGDVIYSANNIQVKLAKTPYVAPQNAFDQVDTINGAIDGMLSAGADIEITNPQDDFVAHFNLANVAPLKNRQYAPMMGMIGQSSTDRLTNVLQAVSKNGPVIMNSEQYRLWVSPFYSHGNTESFEGQPAVRDHHEGVLIGAEKRSLKNDWTVGILTGMGVGNSSLPQYVNTNIRDKSGFVGVYHSMGFLEHARYDVILNSIFSNHHMQRSGKLDANTPYLALSDYKSRTLSANFETSYQFKMQDHSSFRPNLGFTYAENTQDGYSERNAGVNSRSLAKSRDHTKEIYGGLGLRHSWKTEKFECKLTTIWEHGYELVTTNKTKTMYGVSGPQNSISVVSPGTGRHTNYFTVYASALNTDSNVKVMAGYKASVQKHRTNHTFTLKAEYRF